MAKSKQAQSPKTDTGLTAGMVEKAEKALAEAHASLMQPVKAFYMDTFCPELEPLFNASKAEWNELFNVPSLSQYWRTSQFSDICAYAYWRKTLRPCYLHEGAREAFRSGELPAKVARLLDKHNALTNKNIEQVSAWRSNGLTVAEIESRFETRFAPATDNAEYWAELARKRESAAQSARNSARANDVSAIRAGSLAILYSTAESLLSVANIFARSEVSDEERGQFAAFEDENEALLASTPSECIGPDTPDPDEAATIQHREQVQDHATKANAFVAEYRTESADEAPEDTSDEETAQDAVAA